MPKSIMLVSWIARNAVVPKCLATDGTYSALAITTALTLRAVFRLALRQTEGLQRDLAQSDAGSDLGRRLGQNYAGEASLARFRR
jgi:hypothetical protein